MRRVIAVIVAVSLALLPAGLAAGNLPVFTGCHDELRIEVIDGKIACLISDAKLYQRYTYYVRSYGGMHVCRLEVIELRHVALKDPAEHSGIKDPDSVRRYYRVEYGNQTKLTGPDGKERTAFIQVMSGPEGLLIEVLVFIPINAGPTLEDDAPRQEVQF